MELKVICGRKRSGKTTALLNEMKNLKEVLYIVPEQNIFNAEKLILEELGEQQAALMETLSFKKLSVKVLKSRADYNIINFIDNDTKNLLLNKVIAEHREELEIFKNGAARPEFAESLSSQISELKRYMVDIERLSEISENQDLPLPLRKKIKDIKTVYSAYEKEIENTFKDYDDLLSMSAKDIAENKTYENHNVYIDCFTGFTEQETNIIKILLKQNCNVTVSLLSEKGKSTAGDLFYTTYLTKEKLRKAAEETGAQFVEKFFENTYYKNEESAFLEKNLYNHMYEAYGKKADSIKIYSLKNSYAECENAINEMIRIIEEDNARFGDFAFVLCSMDDYKRDVETLFSEYGISYYIDEKTSVSDLSAAGFIALASSLAAYPNNRENLLSYLKSGFVLKNFRNEVFLFENYIREAGVRNYELFGKKSMEEILSEKEKYGFASANKDAVMLVYEKAVVPLKRLLSEVKGTHSASEFGESIICFLESISYKETVEEYINEFNKNGELVSAMQFAQVYNTVTEAIRRTSLIMSDKKINFKYFSDMMKMAYESHNISTIPLSMDSVTVTGISGIGNGKFRYLFVLGMSAGVVPGAFGSEALINELDREYLNGAGIGLSMSKQLKLSEEQLLIYNALCSDVKELIISYPKTDFSLEKLTPSEVVAATERIFPYNDTYTGKTESTVTSKRLLFECVVKDVKKGSASEETLNTFKYFLNDEEYKYTAKAVYENMLSKTVKQNVNVDSRLVASSLDNELNTAVTGLEKYRSCAFSYYLRYILNCKEKKEYSVNVADMGSLSHKILEEFSRLVNEKNMSYSELTQKFIDDNIEEITKNVVENHFNGLFTSSSRNMYLVKKLKRISKRAVNLLKLHFEKGNFEPFGYELYFSDKGGDLKGIHFKLDNDRSVFLKGVIDRVDKLSDADSEYIRVVDYKSSEKKLDFNDIYNGISLQLSFYLLVMLKQKISEKVKPGAMLYLTLDEPIISAANPIDKETAEIQIKNKLRMRGIVLKNMEVINSMDNLFEENKASELIADIRLNKNGEISGNNALTEKEFRGLLNHAEKTVEKLSKDIFNGKFNILPVNNGGKTGCDYCPYGAVCGFDENTCRYDEPVTRSKEEIMESVLNEQC